MDDCNVCGWILLEDGDCPRSKSHPLPVAPVLDLDEFAQRMAALFPPGWCSPEAKQPGGAAYGVSSIIKHAVEMKKSSIGRIARVERDGKWIVFFEAK